MHFVNLGLAIGILAQHVAPTLPWPTGPKQLFCPPPVVLRTVRPASVTQRPLANGAPKPAAPASTGRVVDRTYDPAAIQLLLKYPPVDTSGRFDAVQAANSALASGDDAKTESVLASFFANHPANDDTALFLAEEMVKRNDWAAAARVLVRPNRSHNETDYAFLEAAVLAHQGCVFEGERAALLDRAGIKFDPNGERAAWARMTGRPLPTLEPPGKWTAIVLARFPSESPSDIEAIAWFLGAGAMPGASYARTLGYARRFEEIDPGVPTNLAIMGMCLNGIGRYDDTVRLLRKAATSSDREARYYVGAEYEFARQKLASQGP